MSAFNATVLRALWPHGNDKVPGLIEGIAAAAPAVFSRYGLTDDATIAQAMAQFSHECGAGLEMVENIHYSAERACAVWPSRFRDADDCYRKVGSFRGDPGFPVKLIDSVYGGRMGNRPGTHDGSAYIGRGLSQCTGHDGYARVANATGIDVLANPDLIIASANALLCGVADFVACGCLPYAKAGDIDNVTLKLNGGHIGLAERKAWLTRWQRALGGDVQPAQPTSGGGNQAQRVMALQRQLREQGFDPGAADGALGPKTIKAFQTSRGLAADGIAGAVTKPLLERVLAEISVQPGEPS